MNAGSSYYRLARVFPRTRTRDPAAYRIRRIVVPVLAAQTPVSLAVATTVENLQGVALATQTALENLSAETAVSLAVATGLESLQGVTLAVQTAEENSQGIASPLAVATECLQGVNRRAVATVQNQALANRTTGVAPLAVFFDSGAQGQHFLEGKFEWDFGDPGSGTWSVTGRSKNKETGPVAGHVFETPGTYTVTLGSEYCEITVTDPDTVYSGTNTVCFSQAGNFAGAPSGSSQITTSTWATVTAAVAAGKRILLRRGETWTASSGIGGTLTGPGTFGAFGTGDRPHLDIGAIDLFSPEWDDWRVMDLDIDGNDDIDSRAFRAAAQCQKVLILRVKAQRVHNGLTFSTSFLSEPEVFDSNAIVDCEVGPVIGGSGGNGSMLAGNRLIFMGNVYDDTSGAEHCLRTQHVRGGIYAHSDLGLPATTKHVMKLHALPFDGVGYGAGLYTERIMIARNIFRAGLSSWCVAISTEDDHTDQRLRWILIEGNRFEAGSGSDQQVACFISAENVLARNNVADMSGGTSATMFWVARRGVEPIADNCKFLHNTAYTADNDAFRVVTNSVGTNLLVQGNVGSAPNSSNEFMLSGTGTATENLLSDTPGFVNAPTDFSLTLSSAAKDIVSPLLSVWEDYNGNPRGLLGDAGAYERQPALVPPDSAWESLLGVSSAVQTSYESRDGQTPVSLAVQTSVENLQGVSQAIQTAWEDLGTIAVSLAVQSGVENVQAVSLAVVTAFESVVAQTPVSLAVQSAHEALQGVSLAVASSYEGKGSALVYYATVDFDLPLRSIDFDM